MEPGLAAAMPVKHQCQYGDSSSSRSPSSRAHDGVLLDRIWLCFCPKAHAVVCRAEPADDDASHVRVSIVAASAELSDVKLVMRTDMDVSGEAAREQAQAAAVLYRGFGRAVEPTVHWGGRALCRLGL